MESAVKTTLMSYCFKTLSWKEAQSCGKCLSKESSTLALGPRLKQYTFLKT